VDSLTARERRLHGHRPRLGFPAGVEFRTRDARSARCGPGDQTTKYVDELELGGDELREQVLSLGLHGTSAIFNPSRRTEHEEGLDRLTLTQFDDTQRRPKSNLEIFPIGAFVYRIAVDQRRSSEIYDLVAAHVIDEDFVRASIKAFVAFAAAFYKLRRHEIGPLFLAASLSGIEWKHFGRLPNYAMSSSTIGDPRIPDPLRVPSSGPLELIAGEMAQPQAVADKIVAHFTREFRVRKAYFTP
jgi:hypothetical protein